MIEGKCEYCGVIFQKQNSYKGNAMKFCSRQCYWNSKKNNVEYICKSCGKHFFGAPSSKFKYCSRECFNEDKGTGGLKTSCNYCGKEIYKSPAEVRINKSKKYYCSRPCADNDKKTGFKEKPEFKLHLNISRYVRRTLTGTKRYRKWEDLVGYTCSQLKEHLERRLKPGMTWNNYGLRGWHIDHIIPRTAFNFKTTEDPDFRRCWALSNLKPEWSKDNIRKSNHLTKPFQPSLSFSEATSANL